MKIKITLNDGTSETYDANEIKEKLSMTHGETIIVIEQLTVLIEKSTIKSIEVL